MLEQLKEEVMLCAREAERQGLCKSKSGNFSCRDKRSGLLLMTPTGVNRQAMTADDVVVMDMAGNVVESVNGHRPTSEAFMHISAYEARHDAFAVVHTHSKFAVTFAVLEREIPAIVIEGAHLKPKNSIIPLAPFARQGTVELGESVKKPLKECDAALLAKHGVITVAESLEEALLKAAYVEEIAEIYFNALSVGGNPEALASEDLKLRYPVLGKGSI